MPCSGMRSLLIWAFSVAGMHLLQRGLRLNKEAAWVRHSQHMECRSMNEIHFYRPREIVTQARGVHEPVA